MSVNTKSSKEFKYTALVPSVQESLNNPELDL